MNELYLSQQLVNYSGDIENILYVGYALNGQIVIIEEMYCGEEPDWVAGCINISVLEITAREYHNLKRMRDRLEKRGHKKRDKV